MNKDEIKVLLPHRQPMLLVEEMTMVGEAAHGQYTVRGDEWFLQGHFPGNPVVPGVVLCEMMGQTCAILIGEQLKGKTPFFTGMNKVKFRRSARPGDVLTMVATIQRHNGPFYFTAGQVLVAGQMIAQGEFSFALIPNEEAAAT
ncbi:MAG: 3-hydroxyacyl-ACP dehydratase FabZ family protein [Candidatus Limiplasma sp.]|nr:3-hydroxyacyl-ACP dehydratase FabZ family protein [Candidatus Limiplasma sp.]